ncbi:uncharacterized protein LOC118435213 [Folsomia candida]|uniref:Proteasome activator complex subunit 1 n=1 Tax=Folsomia candida TaxID=158441 RepID=A0A226EEV3_FOLCA|nr:uncharacterized protein LOC118435213 [Folsomia candida]OXA56163.1 Proteasome activator complex subunit 1 [Folsomia candida]
MPSAAKSKNTENNSSSSSIFEARLLKLTEEVEEIISHKMLENMDKITRLREQLNFEHNWKREFQGVKLEYSFKKSENSKEDGRTNEKNITNENGKDEASQNADLSQSTSKPSEKQDSKSDNSISKTRVSSNRKILTLLETIQPYVNDFESTWHTLGTWLELQTSQHQTGSNFGNEVIAAVSKLLDTYDHLRFLGTQDYFEGG